MHCRGQWSSECSPLLWIYCPWWLNCRPMGCSLHVELDLYAQCIPLMRLFALLEQLRKDNRDRAQMVANDALATRSLTHKRLTNPMLWLILQSLSSLHISLLVAILPDECRYLNDATNTPNHYTGWKSTLQDNLFAFKVDMALICSSCEWSPFCVCFDSQLTSPKYLSYSISTT